MDFNNHSSKLSVPSMWPGKPYPLGANYDGKGVNFTLFSERATAVELCLFDPNDDKNEFPPIPLTELTEYVWHIYIPGVKPGQIYGYRVYGEYKPEAGKRFNVNKLLLDPYAKAINGKITWDSSMYGYQSTWLDSERDIVKDEQDNADFAMKSVVIDNDFDWEGEKPLDIPLHASVIYELHVKGFSIKHPDIDPKIRGSYAALASAPAIDYFKKLGITAIELMPVHQFVNDEFLSRKGLKNYWGYNTIGFFTPHNEYSSSNNKGGQVNEFKQMVKTLHKNNIEVIIDVVYNHTGEGNQYGPTLSFKGIDNQAYYRLMDSNMRLYKDYTGTGNTLNMLHSRSIQLVMDSLRYWVTEMHVDGFRFDLASTLARGVHEVEKLSVFLEIIHQDPIISQVKLIAEPWDVGEGGYQVGNFPVLWAEWNGKYRDNVRRFWKGDEAQIPELAFRLTGSSDLYQSDGRSPGSSINFICAHDGFTLHDLVSYNQKHNEQNGENNRDGSDGNDSWNCGVEGLTNDTTIINLREQQKRNFLATLFFSQGVPMICHGDEYGRTQNGNNNAYCQDNEISWIDWNWTDAQKDLFDFTSLVIKLRRENPVLHRRKYFHDRQIMGEGVSDIRWLRPDGLDMNTDDWQTSYVRCIGMLLNGQEMDEVDEYGLPIKDDILLIIMNAFWDKVDFTIPTETVGTKNDWVILVNTAESKQPDNEVKIDKKMIQVPARSLLMLKCVL